MQEIKLKEKNPASPLMSETYRRLRTSLEFSGMDNKVICITSCTANEGKSSVSYYLARSLAKNGKKTLLVDADLRNSVMHKRMSYEKDTCGLSHFLVGKNSIQDIVYKTSFDNLYFTPTGVFPKNPTELFSSTQFEKYIENIRNVFDYIIIDSSPIGRVIDAAVIANKCDAHMIVASYGLIHRKTLQNAINDMKSANPNFLGVVINKVPEAGKGYRYDYGYGYGYGYGYSADKKHSRK